MNRSAAKLGSHALAVGISTALLSVLLLVASAHTARAGGVVTTCDEAHFDAALAGGGLVTFSCGPNPVTITLTSTKTISTDTTIDGGGLITISGGNSVGVFLSTSGVNFTVQNLTIANGNSSSGNGGGIENNGTLMVTNSTFSGNSAVVGGGVLNLGTVTVTNSIFSHNSADDGAGILSFGTTVTVTNSTFSDNSSQGPGGGIENDSGPVTVTNSTFSGNSANGPGGGIYSEGPVTVTNSTFSGNSADDDNGGGVYSEGPVTVTNSTFFGNSADDGGGILSFGPVTVTNTIFANSTSGGNCGGSVTDGGHNIDDDGTCGVGSATNPLLDPAGLKSNGGPTQTIALCTGPGAPSARCTGASPAINAGDEVVCKAPPVNNLDQRGYVRPGAGATNCSIGAYEANTTSCIDNCPDGTSCTSASQCTGGACDSSSHSCCAQTNDCSDGTTCTANSQCRSGTCAGGGCAEPTSIPTATPLALPTPTRAPVCVVGTGTGASCTESALTACLPGGGSFGGTVTFNCGASPVTITVTSAKIISADTTIDGGSLITISGGNSVGAFLSDPWRQVHGPEPDHRQRQ